ncbi:MAG: gamma-glutamyl-gamma-aminobutyrate hydrolase family protein [Trueperaceae bacterium]|nr:gamma-glutamyl-gamma-aminobutyrate hydrolase family protein [Trueperaceae bacterium]
MRVRASARPRVLVTTSQSARERPLRRIDALTGQNYASALVRTGLLPTMAPTLPAELAPALLDGVDGVLFSGGVDIDPARFGQRPSRNLGVVDQERDAFELALYHAARERGLPMLGICRGIQLVAVAAGGTVHQHLQDVPGTHQHEQRDRGGDPLHTVRLTAPSVLADLFGADSVTVNSYHHQAVDAPPDGYRVTARTHDGVVEALEADGGSFVLAVQWHPEMAFPRHPAQLVPFVAFARALGVDVDVDVSVDVGVGVGLGVDAGAGAAEAG